MSTSFPHSLKVGLTDFDMALLSYLQQLTNEPMAEHIRRALHSYATTHYAKSVNQFRHFAARFAAESVVPDRRPDLLKRVRVFADTIDSASDRTTERTAVPSISAVSSRPSHFDHD